MKKSIALFFVLIFVSLPVMAEESLSWLKPVEHQYVCMVNDAHFNKVQIPVEVDGKTYYGCCEMCKDRLAEDEQIRAAIDPVSGNTVDKAEATIGTGPDGAVYYFETAENMTLFAERGKPELEE